MSKVLLAQPVRESRIKKLKEICLELKQKSIIPHLKVILVGNDPASVLYTNNKKKFCESIGAECEIVKLNDTISEKELLACTQQFAADKNVNGILIQLPLPKHLSHLDVGNLIPANKDVDGLNDINIANIVKNNGKGLRPCTPSGIISLLDFYNIKLEGKNICVIGRSMIVGKPLSIMLSNRNATVTLCHSKSQNIEHVTKNADIIISAVGKAHFLTDKFLNKSKDQTIIDVGINHDDDGKLCGDARFSELKDKCSAITPVPGGIGPMTILSLAENLVLATKIQKEIK